MKLSLFLSLFVATSVLGQGSIQLMPVIGSGSGTALPANAAGVLTNDGAGNLVWQIFPASAGGAGGSNWVSATVSNDVSYGVSSPFTNKFRITFVGDSGLVTPSGTDNLVEYLRTNYLIRLQYFMGYTNLGVSGETLDTESLAWLTTYAKYSTGGGTNNIFVFFGGYNDINNGTNFQKVINSQSNLVWFAKQSNNIVVQVDIWGKVAIAQMGNKAKANSYWRTNIGPDYKVEIDPTWSEASGDLSTDGKHPNGFGTLKIGQKLWKALYDPPLYSERMSSELHMLGNFTIAIPGNGLSSRGLSYTTLVQSDNSGTRYENNDNSGAGEPIQLGDKFTMYSASGGGNMVAAFANGTVSNISYLPLTVNGPSTAVLGFISLTNVATASSAISFPATTVKFTNTFGINIMLYIDNTAVTGTAIVKNGQQVFSGLTADVVLPMKPGDYFSETYTVGTPTARWEPQ